MRRRSTLWLLATFCLLGLTAHGQVLTPMGSLKAGNADGTIPPWTGGLHNPDLTIGPDHYPPNPFADEKPRLTITAANMARYAKQLTAGQKALFEAYPNTFRMIIYPSHRTFAAPQWIYQGTEQNRDSAYLLPEGRGIGNLHPGIPFPVIDKGVQAVWNHLLRFRGTFLRRVEVEGAVWPSGKRKLFRSRQEIAFPTNRRTDDDNRDNILLYYSSFILSPSRMAGGGFLLIDFLNDPQKTRLSWTYDKAQRRVRRLPYTSHDSPAVMAENLRTVDDTDMFNGHTDLYAWHLDGRTERWVPYNNYRLPTASLDELLTPHHLNPDFVRWERHRVWRVVGLLKPDKRHLYSKRVFYIDEDSWSILLAESYDLSGKLIRVNVAHPLTIPDIPLTMTVGDVFHDLPTGRYNVKGLMNGEGGLGTYDAPIPDDAYFQPARLRQRAVR
ncbi:DUF1329 domain-containing protein [Marinobacteraceae bacterium S3BR75-40.1]